MGRSVESIRQGANRIADRWARSARLQSGRRKTCGERLAEQAKRHSSEAFYSCETPLEAALFSAFVGILQYADNQDTGGRKPDVDN
jgi:hypothetical protein